ncbi:energy transducer TonB [Reichenbachiella carrageenanivorans]|uniref:Energy transducer TonB n=1 Tax=Reichenbachiella carrageenanivorans TaxID=2979869 RepID=A0ABY6CVJ5_9BACT|nr:energy transducer TonB [Reichenbachiella carrageenanivorans]UXX77888.1 energy transducer TonB [Reichenbachiella carrageenanivorans]
MNKYLTAVLLLVSINISFAQEVIETKYYKSRYTDSKEVSESKAKFVRTKTKYPDGRIETNHTRIKDNLTIWSKTYLNGEPAGIWFQYYDNGTLMSRLDYDQELNYSEETPKDAPYLDLYSKQPKSPIQGTLTFPTLTEYPEGFSSYFVKNMRYPGPAVEKRITGNVLVLISIDEQGNTEVLSILKGAHKYLDLEAFRLLNELPQWNPCKIDGKPTKVYSIVPIGFRLG